MKVVINLLLLNLKTENYYLINSNYFLIIILNIIQFNIYLILNGYS